MTGFNADAFQSAEVPTGEFENNDPPNPGIYDVVIQDAKAFTSKSGIDLVVVEWNITSGPQTGYSWGDMHGFKNEMAVGFTKAMCMSIGVDITGVGQLEDLDASLRQRVGEFYTVEVKQGKKGFRNTYVLGQATQGALSDVPSGGFETAATGASADDDLPF